MRTSFIPSVAFVLLTGANSCTASPSTPAPNIDQSMMLHHQHDQNTGDTYVLNDASVFVAKEGGRGATLSATLFFSGAVDKEALVNKMLWILAATEAPAEFRDWAKKTLPRNRRLEQDSFVVPLRSEKFGIHEFTYNNTGHNQLYILNYRRLASGR